MSLICGRLLSSRILAYGIGMSTPVTLVAGASRKLKAGPEKHTGGQALYFSRSIINYYKNLNWICVPNKYQNNLTHLLLDMNIVFLFLTNADLNEKGVDSSVASQ